MRIYMCVSFFLSLFAARSVQAQQQSAEGPHAAVAPGLVVAHRLQTEQADGAEGQEYAQVFLACV